MRPAIVFGTRPEIIKCAPVIWAMEESGTPFVSIHTGQHYSQNMSDIFIDEMEIPHPKYNLGVGSHSHATQTANIMHQAESVLKSERPSVVLVQGDTNSGLAAALTARKMDIPVGHIEAGLRSFDRDMPEEINRIIMDHISDILWAPTQEARANLVNEGLTKESLVFTVGNTVADVIKRYDDPGRQPPITPPFILATIHRPENTNDPRRLLKIMAALTMVGETEIENIILPMHPRTRSCLQEKRIKSQFIKIIPPLGYHDFLAMERNADIIITDSGGVQEEACILGVPCITVRKSTERPETVALGANIVVDQDGAEFTRRLVNTVLLTKQARPAWQHPYGRGDAGKTIVETIQEIFR